MNAVSTLHSICITPWMTRRCSTHSLTTRLICWFAATNLATDCRLTAPAALQPLKKPRQTQLQHKFPAMPATAAAWPWVGQRFLLKWDVTFFFIRDHYWLICQPGAHILFLSFLLSLAGSHRGGQSPAWRAVTLPSSLGRQTLKQQPAGRLAGSAHLQLPSSTHTHTLM